MSRIRRFFLVAAAIAPLALFIGGATSPPSNAPEYAADGQMKFPERYREWVYLSSGVGMTYGPVAESARFPKMFDNVFVNPEAYHSFLETGHWPDKTTLVLEIRNAESVGSINKGGNFQTDLAAIEVHVKDSTSKNGQWNFYGFNVSDGKAASLAKPVPQTASCFDCHTKNTAVERTFVQFYPVLYRVAQQKGTLNPGFEKLPPTPNEVASVLMKEGWEHTSHLLRDTAAKNPGASVLSAGILNTLGYHLVQSGQKQEAVELLEWAVARHPAAANLHDTLAEAYEKAGKKNEAKIASERTLQLLDADDSLGPDTKAKLKEINNKRLAALSQ